MQSSTAASLSSFLPTMISNIYLIFMLILFIALMACQGVMWLCECPHLNLTPGTQSPVMFGPAPCTAAMEQSSNGLITSSHYAVCTSNMLLTRINGIASASNKCSRLMLTTTISILESNCAFVRATLSSLFVIIVVLYVRLCHYLQSNCQ